MVKFVTSFLEIQSFGMGTRGSNRS